jgi:hypothetical protein
MSRVQLPGVLLLFLLQVYFSPAWAHCFTSAPTQESNSETVISQTIELCGETYEMKYLNPEGPLPPQTQAMRQMAANHPELSQEYIRTNACIGQNSLCLAHDERHGGKELYDEISEIDLSDKEEQRRFYGSVTGEAKARTLAGKVTQKVSFARFVIDYHLLFTLTGNKRFHENAEGVDLASKKVIDEEAKEQEKLADILESIKDKFSAAKDKESAKQTATYESVARSQAKVLNLVSCELKKMADFNREVENKLTGLQPMLVRNPNTIFLDAKGMQANNSTISGEIPSLQKGSKLDAPKSGEESDVLVIPAEEKKKEEPAGSPELPLSSTAASSMPKEQKLSPEEIEKLAQERALKVDEAQKNDSGISGNIEDLILNEVNKAFQPITRAPASMPELMQEAPSGGWVKLDQEAMQPFVEYRVNERKQSANASLIDEEKSIFLRVSERYREREQRGQFQQNAYGL